ncbi:MAG: YafY family transcriptional regulator [Rhodospirillales bacterium]|nr:YafY family transcriptional regulator [Rhodospirillales bacterium]
MGRKRTPGRSRAERLLELVQAFRRRRRPVSAAVLAAELGVSARSLYRDVAVLRAQGAAIEGEAGIGYVMKPGFLLPPLMFAAEEIEALALGAAWVAERADPGLAASAREALARISGVLPAGLRETLEATALLVGPGEKPAPDTVDLAVVRQAIRAERRLSIVYRTGGGAPERRTIWPFGMGFFERARVVMAWCETRRDFRHFRTDRISECAGLPGRYPRRRGALMKEWRGRQGIGEV